jgi:hypothetical protein
MDNALAMVEEAFRRTTLAEILSEPTESVPLCDFPREVQRTTAPANSTPAPGPTPSKRRSAPAPRAKRAAGRSPSDPRRS